MKIKVWQFDHLTQFIFWLDVMFKTEAFSVIFTAAAFAVYILVKGRVWYGLQRIPSELGKG